MTIGFVTYFINDVATLTHSAIKVLQPYQPWIAASAIAGKVFWRAAYYTTIQKEIQSLDERIELLESLPHPSQPLKMELEFFQKLRDEKRFQHALGKWTFGQVPCLLFPHPEANPYRSLHQIFQRSYFMSRSSSTSVYNKGLEIAAGAVCIAGTFSAFLKQTCLIGEENELALRLMHFALAVNLAEGAVMAKSFVKNCIASKNFGKKMGF